MVNRSFLRASGAMLAALFVIGCNDTGPSDPGPIFEVSPTWSNVEEGETLQLTATLNGQPIDVTWESDNEAVATVSSTGLVTAIKDGYAAISARNSAQNLFRSASITVPKLLGTSLTSGTGVQTAAEEGETVLYRIRVPEGSSALNVTLSGGTGDADIYIRYAQTPEEDTNGGASSTATGCHSWNAGNGESCSFANPAKGQWYILLSAWETFAGATLTATVTP